MRQSSTRTRAKKSRKTKKQQKGAAFVAKGSYGCVYKPAFRCESNVEPDMGIVSKVMKATVAKEEYDTTRFLDAIDSEFKYFIRPISLCSTPAPRNDAERVENPLTECKPNYANNNFMSANQTKRLALLQIPFAGQDWSIINPTSYGAFMKSWINIVEGLMLLHSKNYVHMDIKPANLAALEKADGSIHSRYLDFGFSFYTKAPIPYGYRHSFLKNYTFWPYEVRFLSSAYNEIDHFSDASIEKYKQESWIYEKDSIPLPFLQLGPAFYVALWNKLAPYKRIDYTLTQDFLGKAADVYALGKTFSIVYSSFIGHRPISPLQIKIMNLEKYPDDVKEIQKDIAANVSIPLFALCAKMMHHDPFSRPALTDVLAQLKFIVNEFAERVD